MMMTSAKNLALGLLVAAIIALSVVPFLKHNLIVLEQAENPAIAGSKKAPSATALTGQGAK